MKFFQRNWFLILALFNAGMPFFVNWRGTLIISAVTGWICVAAMHLTDRMSAATRKMNNVEK